MPRNSAQLLFVTMGIEGFSLLDQIDTLAKRLTLSLEFSKIVDSDFRQYSCRWSADNVFLMPRDKLCATGYGNNAVPAAKV